MKYKTNTCVQPINSLHILGGYNVDTNRKKFFSWILECCLSFTFAFMLFIDTTHLKKRYNITLYIPVALHVYLNYYACMRGFLITLVIAIFVSGFSTAGHAFDMSDCGISISAEAVADNCGDHLQTDSSQSNTSQDSQHICVDCNHCCMSHASIIHPAIQIAAVSESDTFHMFQDVNPYDNIISGLKRPPKSLV